MSDDNDIRWNPDAWALSPDGEPEQGRWEYWLDGEQDMVVIQRMLRGVLRANLRDPKDRRRPRPRRTRYSRRGHGPNGMRKRAIHRRYTLSSLTGTDSGFSFLTTDGPHLGLDAARLLHLDQTPPWPRGQRRPLP